MMVELTSFVDVDPETLGITEKYVYYPVLRQTLMRTKTLKILRMQLRRTQQILVPMHITKEDIFASINYNMHLEYGVGNADDIDHLGNRRIRAVGELLQNQYRIGLSRMERVVRERMTTQDLEGCFCTVSDQYQACNCSSEGILRKLPAVTVHGSE